MTDDLKDIELNYPSTHSREDTLRILRAYKTEYPDVYEKWVEAEKHPRDYLDDGLKPFSDHGADFLKARCSAKSNMAVSSAWGDLRNEVIREAWNISDKE